MGFRKINLPSFLSSHALIVAGLLFLASCSDDNGVDPIPVNTGIPEIEQRVHTLINQYRAENGLVPLTLSDVITTQARAHSRNMADGSVPFSHDGFDDRVAAISAQIPISGAAENVAMNSGYSDPARIAYDGWLKSEGHRNNIEGNYDLTGIGVYQASGGSYYLTQLFAKSR
jgi:uncharacterized protein YkwD